MKKKDLRKRGAKILTSVGSLLTFYGTIESIIQVAVNVLSFLGLEKQLHQTEKRIEQNMQRLQKLVYKSSVDRKPLLIKFLSEISKKYSSELI